jgi:hypothetical protein
VSSALFQLIANSHLCRGLCAASFVASPWPPFPEYGELDPTSNRAISEYLAVVDDAGFGGAKPVLSPLPTGRHRKSARPETLGATLRKVG